LPWVIIGWVHTAPDYYYPDAKLDLNCTIKLCIAKCSFSFFIYCKNAQTLLQFVHEKLDKIFTYFAESSFTNDFNRVKIIWPQPWPFKSEKFSLFDSMLKSFLTLLGLRHWSILQRIFQALQPEIWQSFSVTIWVNSQSCGKCHLKEVLLL